MGSTAKHWIDGAWVEGGKKGESVDPATGETFGWYWEADVVVAHRAIDAASAAFRRPGWAEDRTKRARVLDPMAARFEARGDELVELLGRENGNVHAHGRFETSIVPTTLRFNAALALTDHGRAAEIMPEDLSLGRAA